MYADVFEVVEPANATLEQIQDAFRSFTPQGQRDRMVSLFLSLLEYAEYSDSLPSVRASGGTRPAGEKPRQPRTNRNGKADSREPAPPSEPPAKDAPAREGSPAKETASGNEDMKRMYFEFLLKKADSSDDTDLLDRIERLVGIADSSDQD